MITETITYTDYNGTSRTEDFMFNLTQAEAMEMEMSVDGGLTAMLNKIVAAQDAPTIMKIFKDMIFRSYGEKSPDGRRFIKSEDISKAFSETEAYNQLFMKLVTDADYAGKFIAGVTGTKVSDIKKKSESMNKQIDALVNLSEDVNNS